MNQMIDILKNPIVLGLMIAGITYSHLYYQEVQRVSNNEFAVKKSVNISIPCMIGALTWFLASTYFDNSKKISNISQQSGGLKYVHTMDKNIKSLNMTEKSAILHLIRKNDIVEPPISAFIDIDGFE